MPKDIWYEVYVSNKEGSHTLETGIPTYKEAKKVKEDLQKLILEPLHIDTWTNKDNPTRIEGVE
jgi:hypothetical protein